MSPVNVNGTMGCEYGKDAECKGHVQLVSYKLWPSGDKTTIVVCEAHRKALA